MKSVLISVLLSSGIACAQLKHLDDLKAVQSLSTAAPEEPREAAIIPVKTLTGDSFQRLVAMLGVFHAQFTADDRMRVIVVYAPKDVVTEMRRVVEALDRQGSAAALGHVIDMTLTFLRCNGKIGPGEAALPADMETVARQLRASTQCKDVHLWESLPIRLLEGKETVETTLLPAVLAELPQPTTVFRIAPDAVARKDAARYVRFRTFNVDFRLPVADRSAAGFSYQDLSIHTLGDFNEGQKTVLGKVSGVGDSGAIFVVVSFKVLD